MDLGRRGVRVITICPGLMRTGSPRNATFKGDHAAEYAWFSVAASSDSSGRRGAELEPPPRWLTLAGDRAAHDNNEL